MVAKKFRIGEVDWCAGLTQLVAQENKISVASDLFRTKILFDWLQQSEENVARKTLIAS